MYSLTCRRNSGSEIMKQEDESSYLKGHWRGEGGRSSELRKKHLSQCCLNTNTLFRFVKTKISCLTWTEFPWFMLHLPHVVTLHTGTLLRLNTPGWALLVINSNCLCLCSFHQLLLQMMARKRWDYFLENSFDFQYQLMSNDTIKINPFKCRLQTVFLEQDCFKYFIRQYTYC